MPSRFIPIRWGRKGRLLGRAGTVLTIFAAAICGLVIIRTLGVLL